jgi:hypothetical protein
MLPQSVGPPFSVRRDAAAVAEPVAGPSAPSRSAVPPSRSGRPPVSAADVQSSAGRPVSSSGTRPVAVCGPIARVVPPPPAVVPPPPQPVVPPPPPPGVPPPPIIVIDSDDDGDVIVVNAELRSCPISAADVAALVRLAPEMPARVIFEEIRTRVHMSLDASRLLLALVEGVVAGERQITSDVAAAVSIAVAVDPSGRMAVQALADILNAVGRRPF